jgi:cysteine-rich repeat protein
VRARCGDGITWFGQEQCDDGNLSNTDDCLNNCVMASCGDGHVWAGVEDCDDNSDDTDDCAQCHFAYCGDGYTWAGHEDCDDGNNVDGDTCEHDCTNAYCGNNIVDTGEQCDDGGNNGVIDCTAARDNPIDGSTYPGCTTNTCGDSYADANQGEQCDLGPYNGTGFQPNVGYACSTLCVYE